MPFITRNRGARLTIPYCSLLPIPKSASRFRSNCSINWLTAPAWTFRKAAGGDDSLRVLYRTFGDLRVYCYRVASVVGLVCIRIFGYRDAAAEPLAENLGLAFQLTNIIRDVKEDAGMGRIYLPAEDLASFKVAAEEFRHDAIPERLRWLLAAEADRAREYYGAARDLMPLIDEDSRPALWVLVSIYARLLEKIAERKYDVFNKKDQPHRPRESLHPGKGFAKTPGLMTAPWTQSP